MRRRKSPFCRFLAFIEFHNSGCWLWKGRRNLNGYGRFNINDIQGLVHRISWEFFRGPVPDGLLVLHKCDVRNCVNPTHLFIGTAKDNMQDCINKCRHNWGEKKHSAKLSEEDVQNIRGRLEDGEEGSALAREFGVHKCTVSRIKNSLRWAHLPHALRGPRDVGGARRVEVPV